MSAYKTYVFLISQSWYKEVLNIRWTKIVWNHKVIFHDCQKDVFMIINKGLSFLKTFFEKLLSLKLKVLYFKWNQNLGSKNTVLVLQVSSPHPDWQPKKQCPVVLSHSFGILQCRLHLCKQFFPYKPREQPYLNTIGIY